jgi:effector-binding domain-containing protein
MKKVKFLTGFVILGILTWYLLVKPSDYIVRFKVGTSPGTLLKEVEEWSLINQKLDSFTYVINNKIPFESLEELIDTRNMYLNLDWSFIPVNDSVTQVKVAVTEKGRSIYNRITAPFINTPFKQTIIRLIQNYQTGIESKLKEKFKVKIVGMSIIPEQNYAYIKLENINMLDKAATMIDNNTDFLQFLNNNQIKKGEFPFLIVDNWSLQDNTINFRYCFPIIEKDSLPYHNLIKYDKMHSKKALKAIYNGNYMTSDRGWFELCSYANRRNINIELKPVEFYYNSPFDGGTELEWVTEIYMPLEN